MFTLSIPPRKGQSSDYHGVIELEIIGISKIQSSNIKPFCPNSNLSLLKYRSAFFATNVLPETSRSSAGKWLVMLCMGMPNIALILHVLGFLKSSMHSRPKIMARLCALNMVLAVLSYSRA